MDIQRERLIRTAAFRWLRDRDARYGGIFDWSELTGSHIILPHRPVDRPDRDRLAARFDAFKRAS